MDENEDEDFSDEDDKKGKAVKKRTSPRSKPQKEKKSAPKNKKLKK